MGERKREVKEKEGDIKDKRREMSNEKKYAKDSQSARSELRDINCTLFATSQTLFIYNTCTDCVKLYISDQQAKAAWRAPLKLNNTQLPPGSLFYSL